MRYRTFIIVGAIFSIVFGFFLGKIVTAESPVPGSSADPVVSKSYVDKAMDDRVQELEKSVAELTVQAQALKNTINELQAKIDKTGGKTTTTSTQTTTPTTPTVPTTSASSGEATQTSDSPVGKTAYIVSSNNFVNLRSGPSTSTSIIKQVVKNEVMRILEVKTNGTETWYRVSLDDKTVGWVASWLVDIK